MRISAQEGTLIVIAFDGARSPWPKWLFVAFLLSIWGAFAAVSLQFRLHFPSFARRDCFLGFLAAMILSFVLAIAEMPLQRQESLTLLPGYGDMLLMFIDNFVSFLAVALGYLLLRRRFPARGCPADAPWLHAVPECIPQSNAPQGQQNGASAIPEHGKDSEGKTDSATSQQGTETRQNAKPVPHFHPAMAIGVGFVLAVCAIVSVLFAPLPGLSTSEMASQLTSTLYMTAIFAIVAGFYEECLFRGLMQSALEARPGDAHPILRNAVAIAISSAFFVFVHVAQSLDHLWALIPIALVSITNGILKVRYRSLFPCILVHMTYNAVLMIPSLIVM